MCCLCFSSYTTVLVILLATHKKYMCHLFLWIIKEVYKEYFQDYLKFLFEVVGASKHLPMSRNIFFYRLYDVIFQKTVFFSVTAGRTSCLAQHIFTLKADLCLQISVEMNWIVLDISFWDVMSWRLVGIYRCVAGTSKFCSTSAKYFLI